MWKVTPFFIFIFILSFSISSYAQQKDFTQKDRERLIRVETTLKVFMTQIEKRFEQIDKRFEQVDKRFEQIDKRFEQIDKRFEQIDKRFEQIDKRFEQMDKRFSELREDMNNRFEQMMAFLWILAAIFTTLTGVVIGFAYWDRRTIIKKARDEAIETIEKEGRLRDLINALRMLAQEDRRVANVLKSFRLM